MGTIKPSQLQAKVLRKQERPDEFKVYKAALEWGLTDPIVLEGHEDFRSEPRWGKRLKPFHHQVNNLITFCRRLPVTLLADDVGLGKTISAGLIISELHARGRLSKVLIVCPKLLGPQWKEELEAKFDFASEVATGPKLKTAGLGKAGAVITTYQSARLYLDKIPNDRFQMLILDEAHKLRNLHGVEEPPQVAKKMYQVLQERRFKYVLMLTATPIQNRLWDLYSLVDLLTVGRGHQNPFGPPESFARRFIAAGRAEARDLNLEAKDEFRSIVYGYMSRVRRQDANLHFPERVVRMYKVDPAPEESRFINTAAKLIQKFKPLTQISLLQALVSSPEAFIAQLANMGKNNASVAEVAEKIQAAVRAMPPGAKLNGLVQLIWTLSRGDPQNWRLVIFTGRRETQAAIEKFLANKGIAVGLINGNTGAFNQKTLASFRKSPPDIRVIVSTEAGSEGLNLQVANVLVNYDLPWNPMVVEQRIGRVQRLSSQHASVVIYNTMLKSTFEEFIVGRLMEKLQLAAHAIGDIESLLEASGLAADRDDGRESFAEQIRKLVMIALEGKDTESATRQAEESIERAQRTLAAEKSSIDSMLGSMVGKEYVGPRAPKLPPSVRSMEAKSFAISALALLGGKVISEREGGCVVDRGGKHESLRFSETVDSEAPSILCAPGSDFFGRLVDEVIATGNHDVVDQDGDARGDIERIAKEWVDLFGGHHKELAIVDVYRSFSGLAILSVRATVAHDSYERLIDAVCDPEVHKVKLEAGGLTGLKNAIESPEQLGISSKALIECALNDEGISEFNRFYLERREEEVKRAAGDERLRKRLEDEFTPRLEITLVGAEGKVARQATVKVAYQILGEANYQTNLKISPHMSRVIEGPSLAVCSISGKTAPEDCLNACAITGKVALKHLLSRSEVSGRVALPQLALTCSLSGKKVLRDEVELSAVSGKPVETSLMVTSVVSGKRAEPVHFARCDFSGVFALHSELSRSDISAKTYRIDRQAVSQISSRRGHVDEFVACAVTGQIIARDEVEQCEVTGSKVKPGILELCEISGVCVLPSELGRCAATNKKALKKFLVTSSVSPVSILEAVAVFAVSGKPCAPFEAKTCSWSGRTCHPDDVRHCSLTGLLIRFEYCSSDIDLRLGVLSGMLDGIKNSKDSVSIWPKIELEASNFADGGKCKVERAMLSPDKKKLAVVIEIKSLFGLRTRHAGIIYAINEGVILGKWVSGKRADGKWLRSNN